MIPATLDLHRGFSLYRPPPADGLDARYDEILLERAVEYGPAACIWQAPDSLVVPRSYRRFDAFEQACAHFAGQDHPIIVRQTGGGIVPQGPGILNVSLAYPVHGPAMHHSEPGYRLICDLLSAALLQLEIAAFPAAVEDSFCDGRYNLAVEHQGRTVKVAGTAQMWKRLPGTPDAHIGLVHALVLVDTDTTALTELINTFEEAIGNDRRYSPLSVISIADHLAATAKEPESCIADVGRRFSAALEHAITQIRVPVI